jgi:ketosteroid isomerase-like protein
MPAAGHPNVDLIRRLYEALEARDLDTIVSLFDPEVDIVQTEELPWGGEYHGHKGLAEFFGALGRHIRSKVKHARVFAAGDRVVQVGRTTGTVNATGAAFDIDEVHLFTVRDGRVVRFEAYIDTPSTLAVLAAPG